MFLGPDGKTIQHKNNGSGSCGSDKERVYTVDYVLEKEVKNLTIKITYYKEIEEVTLPVDLEIGLGL